MGAAARIDSGLQTYLKQISSEPLLSAEQEHEFAEAIQAVHQLSDEPIASSEDARRREGADQKANLARERLVSCNLRLVVTIAKRFSRRGMPLADLIEEGNLGLIRAVESYDPALNTRFSTYASWWIKQAIKRSLINSRQPVHIPAYMVELISRWKEALIHFSEKEGRHPTIREMSEHLEVPERKVQMIRRAVKAYNSAKQSTSDEADVPLSEVLTDDRTPQPDEALFSEFETQALEALIKKLDTREKEILRMRFGLDREEPMTLKEIGVAMSLTRERVRQIERQALGKLGALMQDD